MVVDFGRHRGVEHDHLDLLEQTLNDRPPTVTARRP
jgi:hypothetical protein